MITLLITYLLSPLGLQVGVLWVPCNVPRGSYPTPFLGRLLFKITDPSHKTRYPKKGVGYELLGRNLITKPWAYNPQNTRIHIRSPNKGPRFLNQVPTLRVPLRLLSRLLWGFP